MEKKKIIVSACLLGKNCKYNGGNNICQKLIDLKDEFEFIEICPEVFGGLSIPRKPSEIKGKLVVSNVGVDVTQNFKNGALKALRMALDNKCDVAVLKDGSPSCGSTYIYDGTFSGVKVSGMGMTTKLFNDNNIKIFNEKEVDELKNI